MCGNLDGQKTTYEKRYNKRREKHDLDDNEKEHAEKGNNKRKKVS